MSTAFLDRDIPALRAWTTAHVTPDHWKLPIPADALAELDAFVTHLRANPMDVRLLMPNDYELGACRALMAQVKAVLDDGIGLVVLDRLPVERYSKDELTAIYWQLSSLIARPVAQSFDGRVLYDVRDTGVALGTRVRADLTNAELFFHTDYGYNYPPPYIGLLVLRTGIEGGGSSVASMMHAHNELRRRAPHLLQRLYEPFYWNRHGEHPDDAPEVLSYPMFQLEGGHLRARYNRKHPFKGAELVGSRLDDVGAEAVTTMGAIMDEPGNAVEFQLEAGQIQYVNNYSVAHRRYPYVDHERFEDRRHLVRIFLRDFGHRTYMG
jgi:alpha-ketoglutarate-dependent taurine dioxygenase